jgi:branched-chain amino acid transport system permease protein
VEIIFQLLIDALLLAGYYALLSSGFSLMWGVSGIINLAYGSFVLVGAYLVYTFHLFGISLFLAFPLTVVLGLISGVILQSLLINRLMNYEPFTLLVLTFGFDILLSNLLNFFFKADVRSLTLEGLSGSIFVSHFIVPYNKLLVFLLSFLAILALQLYIKGTWTGKAIRAVSFDRVGAELCGINPGKIYAISTSLATALAMLSGGFYALLQGFTPFDSGGITLKAFFVCVVGGLGNVHGLLLGSLVLALSEVFSGFYLGEGWKVVISLVILVLFLLWRPQGVADVKYA